MEQSQDRRVSLCIPWPLLMDHPGQKRKLGKVTHRYSSPEALTYTSDGLGYSFSGQ